jgi:hypothetical protein
MMLNPSIFIDYPPWRQLPSRRLPIGMSKISRGVGTRVRVNCPCPGYASAFILAVGVISFDYPWRLILTASGI